MGADDASISGKTANSDGARDGMLSADGGGRGIRTLDTVSRIHTFQACAFNRSATPPDPEIDTQKCVLRINRDARPISSDGSEEIGAGEGIRTLDPHVGNVMLYP